MGLTRGDIVTVAPPGEFGKPRPAIVIQSDFFAQTETVVVLLITSELRDLPLIRVSIETDQFSGLNKPSQIMLDKIMTVKREKIGTVFGKITKDKLLDIEIKLAVFLGIAK